MELPRTDFGALDLNLLHAMVVLVEERSTTRAARRLGLAQSTVSGTLARLREVLGGPLLVRSGRALEPTPRGLELAAACRPHLDGLAAAMGARAGFDPAVDAREFGLGCTDALAFAVLPGLMATLRAEAPRCTLSVRVADYRGLPEMLARGEVATVLAYLRDDPSATAKTRVLRRSPWVVLRDAGQPAVADVAGFCARPHALVTPSGALEGIVDAALRKAGRTRRVVLGLSSFGLLLGALPGTDMVATVPDFVAPMLAQRGGLAVDPCPVAVAPVVNRMAWGAAADGDPAERWFRGAVMRAFAATSK